MVLSVLISGCAQTQQEPLCKSPYIEYKAGECCLDQNINSICDADEKPVEPIVEETPEEEPKQEPVKETITFSVSDAKAAIIQVYGESTTITENGFKPTRRYNGTTLNYIDVYDSFYTTIIKIKDEEQFINTDEEFKEFVFTYEDSLIYKNTSMILNEQGKQKYDCAAQRSSNIIADSDNRLIDYRYWCRRYELKYGDYVGKQPITPMGGDYIYLKCTPDLIMIVRSNGFSNWVAMWGSLTTQEYDDLLESSLDTDKIDALEEAKLLLDSCP